MCSSGLSQEHRNIARFSKRKDEKGIGYVVDGKTEKQNTRVRQFSDWK